MTLDQQIRMTAFEWLSEESAMHGEVFPRTKLQEGFPFKGERISLISPRGIFKPKQLDIPLSITTAPEGPYDDSFNEEDLLLYRYFGTDPGHRDNVGLRRAMQKQIPLVYFHGIVPSKYLAVWPVYIVGDDPEALTFKVAADQEVMFDQSANQLSEQDEGRRRYITSTVRRRLHQTGFRDRVLAAYRNQCAFCKLKHEELIDAAHIIPDDEPEGKPTVDNGLALCKIHHTAFDRYIIGVNPDYEIEVKEDILREIDGPMLKHGLQELHQQELILPKSKELYPSQEKLEWKYRRFREAG